MLNELFVHQNWSLCKIKKHFNQLKVDGWDGWTVGAIKKLLWSENLNWRFQSEQDAN